MEPQSSNVCDALFLSCVNNTLPQGKPPIKHLILDGHSARAKNLDMLEFFGANFIIVQRLSSRIMRVLQPLIHAF
jgi:hypothetical protein